MTVIYDNINNYFESIKVLGTKSYKNMTVIGVNTQNHNKIDLMMLDTGLDMGLVEISEIGEGIVSRIKLKNKAVTPLLIMDGEEIVGAKQNRIVNSTIIIPPKCTKEIPVSCTEHGRWNYTSKNFRRSDHMATSNIRQNKSREIYTSLKNSRGYTSNQSAIWEDIADIQNELKVESETRAQNDTYESVKTELNDYMKEFTPFEGQNGIIVISNGKVKGLELLYDEIKYKKFHNKIIESYVIDAIKENEKDYEKTNTDQLVRDFIRDIKESDKELFDSENEGDDYRINNDKVTGFTLVYDSNIINASLFNAEE